MHSKHLWKCCHLLTLIQLHSSASTCFMESGFFFCNSIANKCNTCYVNGLSPGFLQALLPLDQGQDRERYWREIETSNGADKSS